MDNRHTNLPDEIEGGEEHQSEMSWYEVAFYALAILYFAGHALVLVYVLRNY